MIVISDQGNYIISSSFGPSVVEGTASAGTNGQIVLFSIEQKEPVYNSFYWKIEPISGSYGDFWEDFFSNRIGGEPADEFATSGFTSGAVDLKINPDNLPEIDEQFQISFYLSNMDPGYYGRPPVATAKFSILNDDKTQLVGDYRDDVLRGTSANDTMWGNSGNDRLSGLGGNDLLDGGAGFDSAVYSGLRKQYTVAQTGQGHTVNSAADGTDTLVSIEEARFADGRLVFDTTDHLASSYRLYKAAFNRTPDAQGLNYSSDRLDHGGTLNDLGTSFVSSPEFKATYGALSDTAFVQQLYQNVLGRAGDVDGLSYWTGHLANGTLTRGQVLIGFSESPENIANTKSVIDAGLWDADEQAASVARLYSAALDRLPDSGGLVYYINTLKSGASLANIADNFVASSELQSKYGNLNNSQYVDQLYHNVLDRSADASGLSYWLDRLNSGVQDRGDVLLAFSESPEHQAKTDGWLSDGLLFA